MYVILDGFTLGTGILLPLIQNYHERNIVMSAVLPTWDGNQTWLVLGGAALYGAFPLAFSTLLPILYLPLMIMVLALLFRGVVFEFRLKSKKGRRNWDRLYSTSSIITAFIQGVVFGAFVQGFDIQITHETYHYVWLTPFTISTGIALVFGYALLGATRLLIKTEGVLNDRICFISRILTIVISLFIVLFSFWTPHIDAFAVNKWFDPTVRNYLIIFPIICLLAFLGFWCASLKKHDVWPYWCVIAMFLSCYIGFGITTWPYIVPHAITIWQAAAPLSTLAFILPGAIIMIPILLFYTGYSYHIFRGKIKDVIKY